MALVDARYDQVGDAPDGNAHDTSATTPYRSKRAIDIVLGFVLAVIATPVILSLAVVSAITLRARPFFVQGRVGWNSHDFALTKIRSLPRKSPPYADVEQLASIRVGRWGGFIRRRHLDELPQLWQVVKGDLSLVGPRPMIHSIVDRLPDDHRVYRHSIRPGLTGLWQVSEDGERLVLEAAHYDQHYVDFANLKLDFWILWVTVKQVLGARRLAASDMPAWVQIEPSSEADD